MQQPTPHSATDFLRSEHERFRSMLREYQAAGENGSSRGQLITRLFLELRVHEEIEEQIFYPALRREGGADAKEHVLEGIEEHHVADLLMLEVEACGEGEVREAKMGVLAENVEHHLKEEEEDLFPAAEKALEEALLISLGESMLSMKRQLLGEGAPAEIR